MSTKTTNLELVKPELTDVADITAMNKNWDKIDEKLKDALQGELEVALPISKGGTGKTKTDDAFTYLSTRASVGSNNPVNADTLTVSGIHQVYFEGSTYKAEDYNFPYSYGVLVVNSSNPYVGQLFYSVSANKLWYRTRATTSSPWGEWYGVYDTSSTVSIKNGGTGGTTQNGAIANLLCRMLINDTSIVDANTLVHTGIHKVYVTDSTVATNNHYPYVYGNLFVVSNMESTSYTYITQLFLAADGCMFIRSSTNNGSTWTDWAKTYTTTYKPSAADIGKPSGQYFGNGSASRRTVDTGGTGNAVLIHGNGYESLVTSGGAFYFRYVDDEPTVKVFKFSEIEIENGVITINSTHAALNFNGGIYNFQVL